MTCHRFLSPIHVAPLPWSESREKAEIQSDFPENPLLRDSDIAIIKETAGSGTAAATPAKPDIELLW